MTQTPAATLSPLRLSAWLQRMVDSHQHGLLRSLSRLVDSDTAQDLAQESFMRLLVARSQSLPPPDGEERPWVFRVARNLAIDHVRRARRDDPLLDEHLDAPSVALSQEQQLASQQALSALELNIESLPPRHKEVLRLKYFEEFSYQEIADITGHTISYVGVLLHEAVRILRERSQT